VNISNTLAQQLAFAQTNTYHIMHQDRRGNMGKHNKKHVVSFAYKTQFLMTSAMPHAVAVDYL